MKICVAQSRPLKGDIQSNIVAHKKIIDLAVNDKADIIIFPELSLTGYEPALAKELATDQEDSRFNDFQNVSDTHQITIGVGVPTKNKEGISISGFNQKRFCSTSDLFLNHSHAQSIRGDHARKYGNYHQV